MAVTVETAQGRKILVERPSATVGRDPGCTVAFPDDARLLPQHAVLREVSGRWMIEAKGPQLLQIGDGPPARVHWLNPGDVIRLTPAGPELTFQPTSAMPAAESSVAAAARQRAQGPRDPRTLSAALWAGAAVVVLGALFVAVFVLARRPPDGGNAVPPERPADREPAAPAAKEPVAVAAPQEDTEAAKPAVAQADVRRALYSVTVSIPDQGQVFQLGTACAVSEHHLLTSAAVALALEGLKDTLPAAAVSSPVLKQQFDIVRWTVHPQYRSAVADADRAQESIEDATEQLQEATEPEQKKQLAGQIADAEQAYAEALGRQVAYDLAVLEVGEQLPAAMPLATGDEMQLAVGARAVVAGLAFGAEQRLVDPESPTMPQQSDAQVFALQSIDETPGAARRVLIKVSDNLGDRNWSGSPLLNRAGKVVAVYSRPAVAASNQAPAAKLHVASSVDRLAEFAGELVPRISPE